MDPLKTYLAKGYPLNDCPSNLLVSKLLEKNQQILHSPQRHESAKSPVLWQPGKVEIWQTNTSHVPFRELTYPLKINAWNTKKCFWGGLFSGAYVSFMKSTPPNQKKRYNERSFFIHRWFENPRYVQKKSSKVLFSSFPWNHSG